MDRCIVGYNNHKWKLLNYMMIGGRADFRCERCEALAIKSSYHSAYKIVAPKPNKDSK